jgi:hypothetical protein
VLRFLFILLLGITYAQEAGAETKIDTTLFDQDYFFLKAITPSAQETELKLLDSAKAKIKEEKSKSKTEIKTEVKAETDTTLIAAPEVLEITEFEPPDSAKTITKIAEPKPKPPQKKDLENMSYEELFKAAFKTEAVRAHYFIVRFFADGKNFGNAEISYDSAFTSFNFYSIPFSKYLDTILLSDERPRINGSNGFFNSQQLKEFDFEINLDERIYELHIGLPPDIKELQHLNLGRTTEPKGTLIKPAFFSFYANLHAMESLRCIDGRDNDCTRNALFLDFDGAAALGGFVLEGSGYFREPLMEQKWENSIKRGDIRLVKDIFFLNSRLSLGDVGGMGGIRYEHSSSIFARNRTAEQHKINFFLPKASYVEIHIDGKLNRRLYLPSGHHEISGFSGHTGVNAVQVFIPQPNGTMQEVKYEFELGDGRTMQKGESRYYINAGIRRTPVPTPTSYKYHPDEPGLNAEYTYGLFHSLSLGFLWQLSQQNLMSGLLLSNANPLGYTEFQGSINASDSASHIGKRAELRHYYNIVKPFPYMDNADFSVTGYFQNSTYNPYLFVSQSGAFSEFAGLFGSIGSSFFETYFSINAGAYFYHKSETQDFMDYRYGAAASRSLFGFSLNASMSSNVSKFSTSYSFALGISYNFGIENHRVRISNDLGRNSNSINSMYIENPYYYPNVEDGEMDYEEPEYIKIPGHSEHSWYRRTALGWDWSSGGSNTGGQRYSVNVATQDNINSNIGANVNAYYYFNRAEMGAGYNFYSYENTSGKVQTNTINARAATSFMFADGLWAFGRPVRGGFILADVNNSLSGATVRINYSEGYDKDLSHSGWLGAAYKNSITSYHHNTINIRLIDMPIGAWLEQNQYYAIGAYKQGYALRLGNDMRVFMQVRLSDERGNLSNFYTAILQIDQDNKVIDKRITFTSKEGVLQMGNLIPGGKYRISFDPSTYIKDIDIDIPSDSEPFLELPDIKVER